MYQKELKNIHQGTRQKIHVSQMYPMKNDKVQMTQDQKIEEYDVQVSKISNVFQIMPKY